MKILLVYPQYPDTFWSFKHALKFTSKRALNNPLGMLTVAAMLPADWEKKAVDMNVSKLDGKDIRWADYVFISAMVAQQQSAREVIDLSHRLNKKVVAGGPLFTTGHGGLGFDDVDYLVLNEAEITLPLFLEDLQDGCLKHIYETKERADITKTPVPMFSLLDMTKYSTAAIQYSRGCPFDCEFCDIIVLDGRKPRTKGPEQMLAELEAAYASGYQRGSIFVVDDNFIGNKNKLKADILPAIIKWNRGRGYPFKFTTEASINLADDDELLQLMSDAGFDKVFVGIESPNEESLVECNKFANKGRDLMAAVKKLQNYGFEVMGGFIVGFDNDDPASIFKNQIAFIQRSGIVTAMVGILNAPPETRLWDRLKKENRLLPSGTGDNTDGTTNLIPKMGFEALVNGYKQILRVIYAPKNYYERIHTFLKEYKPNEKIGHRLKLQGYQLMGFIKSTIILGVKDRARNHYWGMVITTLRHYPKYMGIVIQLAIQGFHLRKVAEKVSQVEIEGRLLDRQAKVLNSEMA